MFTNNSINGFKLFFAIIMEKNTKQAQINKR